MPAGDRTGPEGQGARTGRGAGYCSGFEAPGYVNDNPGRGFGMGWGARRGGWGRGRGSGMRGRGWGRGPGYGYGPRGFSGYHAPVAVPQADPAFERHELKQQAEWLKNQLDAVEARLSNLEDGE